MDWTYNTIWKEQLPAGTYASIDFSSGISAAPEPKGATYFNVHKFKTKHPGFYGLNGVSNAEYLEVNFSNITSFVGVGKLGRIRRLELCWCLNLVSDAGLAEVKDHLEWLHIDTSKKFSPSKDLYDLHNLKVLCLNGCSPLEDLQFLKRMPSLLDFRFVDTNVLNGDLTPLIEHPSLVNAGFLDKRHYNLKARDVAAHLMAKNELAKEYASKGDFQTYRYRAFGGRA